MNAMQDVKRIELREKDPNTNTKICFEIRATALRPRLYTEGFSLFTKELPQRYLYRGITNYNPEYTTSTLSHLYTRGRHKVKHKVKRNTT